MNRLAAFLVRHRRINAAIMIAVTMASTACVLRIRFENSVESFFPPNDPDLVFYQQFRKTFGDDQSFLLVIPMDEVFTRESLARLDELCKALKRLPMVRKVRSLTEAQDIVGTDMGFEVLPFIDKIPDDPAKMAALRATALVNPLYRYDMISTNGRIASVLIEARHSREEGRYRDLLVAVKGVLDASPFKDSEYYLAGDPLVELQMTHDMWRDLFTLTPGTFLVLAIILLLTFRNVAAVAVQLVVISLSLGWLLGFIGMLGRPINAVTVGLPTLLLCVAVLNCIHVFNLYRQKLVGQPDRLKALQDSIGESLSPCFFAILTTAIGLASNGVSNLVPIANFGLVGAVAVLMTYPICFLTLPLLLGWLPPDKIQVPAGEKRALLRVFDVIRRYHDRVGFMTVAIILMLAVSAVGLSRVHVETCHLNFLRADDPVKKATDFIESHIGGVTPMEIVVETPGNEGVKEPRALRFIERLQAYLKTLPGVLKTVSPVEFVKEMNQAFNEEQPAFYTLPDRRNVVAQYIETYNMGGRDNALNDFVDFNYHSARIRGRTSDKSSAQLMKTFDRIREWVKANGEPDLPVRITSHSLIQTNMVNTLVRGQIGGLLISTLLLYLVFAWLHRSWTIGVLGLIPNIIPLAVGASIMGFTDITLNAGTAMTTSIAFGLVVDDTIHLLHHYREKLQEGVDIRTAVERSFHVVGTAVILSSVVLVAGFAVVIFGRSLLTSYFGLLCAANIAVALLCDLFITPFLVIHVKPFRDALARGRGGKRAGKAQ